MEIQSATDRPKVVSISVKMIYLSVIIGLLNPILIDLTTDINNFSDSSNIAIILFSSCLLAFLAYDINRRRNWARIVYSTLYLLSILVFPFIIIETFAWTAIGGILSSVQAIIQALAVILLFMPDSRNWFKNRLASN